LPRPPTPQYKSLTVHIFDMYTWGFDVTILARGDWHYPKISKVSRYVQYPVSGALKFVLVIRESRQLEKHDKVMTMRSLKMDASVHKRPFWPSMG